MRKVVTIVFLLSAGTIPASAYNGYVYRTTVTFDQTKVSGDQVDFPILVSTTSVPLKSTANGGNVQTGYDIVFSTKNDCSYLLKWDTETYNASSGQLIAWVKIPNLSASAPTVFYMCYGKTGITTYQGDAAHTWDDNFIGVWHLGDGGTISTYDSTGHGNTLTNTNVLVATGVVVAMGAYAATNSFSDTGVAFGTGTINGLVGKGSTGTVTLVRSDTSISASRWGGWQLGADSQAKWGFYGQATVPNTYRMYHNGAVVCTWNRIVGQINVISYAFDNTSAIVHSSGTAVCNYSVPTPLYNSDASLKLMGVNPTHGLPGNYDEFRLSSVKRSEGWLTTQSNVLRSLALPVFSVATTDGGAGGTSPPSTKAVPFIQYD